MAWTAPAGDTVSSRSAQTLLRQSKEIEKKGERRRERETAVPAIIARKFMQIGFFPQFRLELKVKSSECKHIKATAINDFNEY